MQPTSVPLQRCGRCGVGYNEANTLCPQWVYKTCWGDNCNHRNHLSTILPSIWLSSKLWETDKVLEVAVEERVPRRLAGQEEFLGQRAWSRPANGQRGRWVEVVREDGLSVLRDLHICCSSADTLPSPFSLLNGGSLRLLRLDLNIPVPRGLLQLFCLSGRRLHCTILYHSILFFPTST